MKSGPKHVIYCCLLQLCIAGSALAVDTIQVLALFKGKAVVMLDDKRRTLSVGKTSPEGLRLISADSDKAVIEFNGQRKTYPLGNAMAIGTTFKKPSEKLVQAISDDRGMFHIQGSANGVPLRFLIDTGATTIAMNSHAGRRLGIDYRLKGQQVMVSTASGITKGYRITLNTVKVGEIMVRNVDAVVVDGDFPPEVLLGMSFLGRVQIERDGNIMRLRKKF